MKKESFYLKLPNGYQKQMAFALLKDTKSFLKLMLSGAWLFVLVSVIPIVYLLIFIGIISETDWKLLFWVGSATFLIIPTLHVLLEYIAFTIMAGKRPKLKLDFTSYFYTIKPPIYFKRIAYLLAQAFPLLALTLISLVMMPFVSVVWRTLLLFSIAVNLLVSIAKIVVGVYLWQQPANILIRDDGLEIMIFAPEKTAVKKPFFIDYPDERLDMTLLKKREEDQLKRRTSWEEYFS